MCGRYRLSRHKQVLLDRFGVEPDEDFDWQPRYNIAPTDRVPVIRQDPRQPRRRISLLRWGLIPSWAKDASVGARMINARAESAAEKPAFRDALMKRRCLVPADGFYEWKKLDKTRQPYSIGMADGELFAFAGVWERWKDPVGQWVKSFSILTTEPNRLTREVHDRMPAIVDPGSYDLWLDPGLTDLAAVGELVKPFEASRMRMYPVSARVNSVKNDDAACAEEMDATPPQGQLGLL